MAKQSTEPLARLLERYGDPKKVAEDRKEARTLAKNKLVAELLGLLEPKEGESKDRLRARPWPEAVYLLQGHGSTRDKMPRVPWFRQERRCGQLQQCF